MRKQAGGSVAHAFNQLCSLSLNRVGVIRASPSSRAVAGLEDIDQTEHGAVGASDHEESADDDDEAGPADHELPPHGTAVGRVPVVVEPHGSHGLETHEGTEDGAHERDEAAEGGDAAGDAVGDDGGAEDAADPGAPVHEGVGGEVLRVSEEADEDVLGGQVGVEDHGDHQTGEGEAVGDLLHESTSGTESGRGDEGSAEVVDDDADDEVGADSDTTAKGERPDVLLGVPHLRGDGEVGWDTGESKDERGDGRHGLGKGGVTNELPVRLEVTGLRSSGRAVLDTSGDGDGEDGSEDGEHANPCEPADLAQSANAGNGERDDEGDGDKNRSTGPVR